MKYNILTVANKSYVPFLDVFLNSIHANCDLEKINKIYVVGVDLSEYKNKLINSDKIVYLDNDTVDNFSGVHSEGWYNTTKQKTIHLIDVLTKTQKDESIIMIDSDTVILEDIFSIINKDYDLQITKMSAGAHISQSGILILHIACFMIFNNIDKSIGFVKKWIENMDKMKNEKRPKPHETPAMNQVIESNFMDNIKWQSLDDKEVCADLAYYSNTKIIHFKSNGTDRTNPIKNFLNRFQNIKFEINDEIIKPNYLKYLNRNLYNLWSQDDMNITSDSFYNITNQYKK